MLAHLDAHTLSSREPPSRALRLPDLRALVRHLPTRLPVLRRTGAGLHAAARAPGGRRVPARGLGRPLRGRELAARDGRGPRVGRRRLPLGHARPAVPDPRRHPARPPVVLGGPSVSGCPEYYPDADLLHLGELGDATDRLIEHLDRHPGRPREPLRFETVERLPLAAFPTPAYHLIRIREYFLANVQFSSGCPYSCEFCDIPALYGKNPRLKSPAQVLRELDLIAAAGATSVYFVDDNFIGNQKAALELLPHLVAWQERHRYPLRFACEATLNLAKNERVLDLMREAGFVTVFCGIETPEPHALHSISKDQEGQCSSRRKNGMARRTA